MASVEIISYAFGHSSPKPHSRHVPALLQKTCATALKGAYAVWSEADVPQTIPATIRNNIKNYDAVVRAVTALAQATADAQWKGRRSLALGGDHSQGFPTIKATLLVQVIKAMVEATFPWPLELAALPAALRGFAYCGEWNKAAVLIDSAAAAFDDVQAAIDAIVNRVTVIWIDAHADFNTDETSGSQQFHGMSLAAACGLSAGGIEGIFGRSIQMNPANIHILGARDLDEHEQILLEQHGVHFTSYDMHDIEAPRLRARGGIYGVTLAEAMEAVLEKADHVIVSVDIDHLDIADAPATGTALQKSDTPQQGRLNRFGLAPAGVGLGDTRQALFNIMQHPKLLAADLSESGFAYGHPARPVFDNLKTIMTTVDLLADMLGMARSEALAADIIGQHRESLTQTLMPLL